MRRTICFHGGCVLKDHAFHAEDFWICGGKIVPPQPSVDEVIDATGLLIAPGYIDMQINGGFGVDFSKQPEAVDEVAKRLARFGVTGFLPTIVSTSVEGYRRTIPVLRSKMGTAEGAQILGIHLEGPFINSRQAGAHDSRYILSGDFTPEEVYGDLERVKIVTLAPEIPGAMDMIAALHARGILVSAGHTCATEKEMLAAIQKGLGFATHLFNAMAPFHHRNPGVVGTVLAKPKLPFSLIADRHHLSSQAVELAWRCNPQGLVLVSDAMEALGKESGTYSLASMDVAVEAGRATIAGTDTLAGSAAGLDEAVRYLRACTGCSPAEAIEAASSKPAQLLGIERSKGCLGEGADADFNLLDEELNVIACYVGGNCFFSQKES
jgi:N-acetylglucosamine-6-phosphate deacetylase